MQRAHGRLRVARELVADADDVHVIIPMKRYTVEVSSQELFALEAKRQRVSASTSASTGVAIIVRGVDPAPAPAPSFHTANQPESEAEDEEAVQNLARGDYSTSEMSPNEKLLVRDLLIRKTPTGADAMDCQEVLSHFAVYHPRIGNKLSLRTLQRWRAKQKGPIRLGPKKKQGKKLTFPAAHRREVAMLIKEMDEHGSPMNYRIARAVILGYMEENSLMHLYSERPSPGKISLEQTWINDLFLEYNLTSRKNTTDAQHVPEASPLLLLLLALP
jgi:hypothetical protein